MLLFYAVFDGIISYITPVAIKNAGYTNTMLGIILGFSSLAGAVFDFLLSKYLPSSHFRRIFFLMFISCSLLPLLIFTAKSFWVFMLAMAIWGLYYDLSNFGTLDFVSRKFNGNINSVSFYLMNAFMQSGYLVFFVLFGLGSVLVLDRQMLVPLYLALGVSFLFYLLVLYFNKKDKTEFIPEYTFKSLGFFFEGKLWMKVSGILFPLLIVTVLINIYDSIFWTLGPLLAGNMSELQKVSDKLTAELLNGNINTPLLFNYSGVLFYMFLALIVTLVLLPMKKMFDKKKKAFILFLAGSLSISVLFFIRDNILMLFGIFFASGFFGLAVPILDGAYADYIDEMSAVEKEIEGLRDFFTNLGYVIGPVAAGVLADRFGYISTFSLVGMFCAFITFILIILTSKRIRGLHSATQPL